MKSPFKMNGSELKRTEYFPYLGVIFDAYGIHWPMHWKRLNEKARKSLDILKGIVKGIKLSTGIKVLQSFIMPIIEYGLCICPERDSRVLLRTWKNLIKGVLGYKKLETKVASVISGLLNPLQRR
jgi:hypothetical protein